MRESREGRRGGGENSHYGHKFNTWVNCFQSKTLKSGRKCNTTTKAYFVDMQISPRYAK